MLYNRIREFRRQLRMRQSDLADRVDVTRQTVLAIEKQRLNPSITIALKLARVFGQPVETLFYLAEKERDSRGIQAPSSWDFPPERSAQPAAVYDFV